MNEFTRQKMVVRAWLGAMILSALTIVGFLVLFLLGVID